MNSNKTSTIQRQWRFRQKLAVLAFVPLALSAIVHVPELEVLFGVLFFFAIIYLLIFVPTMTKARPEIIKSKKKE